jgi:hypothetical protein
MGEEDYLRVSFELGADIGLDDGEKMETLRNKADSALRRYADDMMNRFFAEPPGESELERFPEERHSKKANWRTVAITETEVGI